ncbi:hypothetical protein BDV35DRAFT_362594, partial [Aspergillus flavus]
MHIDSVRSIRAVSVRTNVPIIWVSVLWGLSPRMGADAAEMGQAWWLSVWNVIGVFFRRNDADARNL